MEKSKKNIGAKIAAALVAVTALTCCVVGTTFAKYTSATNATANATVAEWQVEGISENSASKINQITFTTGNDKLSPAVTGTTNTLSSEEISIRNNSDVDAIVTYAISDITIAWTAAEKGTATYSDPEGTETASVYNGKSYNELAKSVFTVSFTGIDTTGTTLSAKSEVATRATVTLTWNTLSDEIDTYFGMYATQVTFTVTLTATQSSQLPTT